MKKFLWVATLFCLGLSLWTHHADADQVRVDSTGGLDMVLTDETTDVNFYNLGNPAGVALLPAGSRLEVAVPWFSTMDATGNGNFSTYGISPDFFLGFPNIGSGYQYQGLLYVPGDDWAFQGDGAFSDSSNQSVVNPTQIDTLGGQEFAQVARQFGPLAFGAKILMVQDSVNDTGYENSIQNTTAGLLDTGLIYSIPLGSDGTAPWLRLGGSFQFNVLPDQTNFNFSVSKKNPVFVNETTSASNLYFVPSLLLDIPDSFQGGVELGVNQSSAMSGLSSSNPNIVPDQTTYQNETDDDLSLNVVYKWKLALSPPEDPHPLTFNQGASLNIVSFTHNSFNPVGTITDTSNRTETNFQAGVGLEREKDFTLGFELFWQTDENTQNLANVAASDLFNYSSIRFTLGGEKWLSNYWALRMGAAYVEENNLPIGNLESYSSDFFDVYPGEVLTGFLWTAGAGYQDKGLVVDGMVLFEQPQSTGTGYTGPEYSYTVIGAQLSIAVLFND
jgi:hypothetical protein